MCDRIVIINRGTIVADDTAAQLSHKYSQDHRMLARIAGPEKEIQLLLEKLPGADAVHSLGEKESGVFEFEIIPAEGADIRRDLFDRLSSRSWPLLGLKSMEMSLEEIFTTLTQERLPMAGGKKKGGKKK